MDGRSSTGKRKRLFWFCLLLSAFYAALSIVRIMNVRLWLRVMTMDNGKGIERMDGNWGILPEAINYKLETRK